MLSAAPAAGCASAGVVVAQVYVSSTVADLRAERAVVFDWLRLARHQAVDSYLPDSDTVRGSCWPMWPGVICMCWSRGTGTGSGLHRVIRRGCRLRIWSSAGRGSRDPAGGAAAHQRSRCACLESAGPGAGAAGTGVPSAAKLYGAASCREPRPPRPPAVSAVSRCRARQHHRQAVCQCRSRCASRGKMFTGNGLERRALSGLASPAPRAAEDCSSTLRRNDLQDPPLSTGDLPA
jgi:hypothetical protein